jgi:hypothetical protein
MERKRNAGTAVPDCASLHPGYKYQYRNFTTDPRWGPLVATQIGLR